jgi:hypothetical protein
LNELFQRETFMAKYLFVVMTKSVPGQDEAFNDWYTNRHLDDVLKLKGFVAAQRFKFLPRTPDARPSPYPYLALYEVETDDLQATQDLLRSTAGSEAMPWHPGLDRTDLVGWYFQPISERVTEGSAAQDQR